MRGELNMDKIAEYLEPLAKDDTMTWVIIGFGILFLVGAILSFVRGAVKGGCILIALTLLFGGGGAGLKALKSKLENSNIVQDTLEDYKEAGDTVKEAIEDLKENEAVGQVADKAKEIVSEVTENEEVKQVVSGAKDVVNKAAKAGKDVLGAVEKATDNSGSAEGVDTGDESNSAEATE